MGKDVTIDAVTAWAHAGPAPVPAAPPIEAVMHHCPLCHREFPFEEFMGHARACATEYQAKEADRGEPDQA